MKTDNEPFRNPQQLRPVDVMIYTGAVTLAVLFLAVWFDFDPEVLHGFGQFAFAMGVVMVAYCIGYMIWG